jgi:endoglucanase Acf2
MPRRKINSKKQKPQRTNKLTQTCLNFSTQSAKTHVKCISTTQEASNKKELNNKEYVKAPSPPGAKTDKYRKPGNAKRYMQIKLQSNIDTNDYYGDNIFDQHDKEIILFHNINGIKDEAN